MKNIKRSLVVSGGGSKGAWAGGFLQYKVEEQGYDWDSYYGTSTGSMVITLTALHEMEKLKKGYTELDNDAIWSVNPFNKKGNIKLLNVIKRLILNKNSIGETGNLHKRLQEMFTEKEYDLLIKAGKKLTPCISNYSLGRSEYGSNLDLSYEEYLKYTWASTSVPVACGLVEIGGDFYLDGGVLQHVPIQQAIDDGADEIDVIVLRPENNEMVPWKPKKGMLGVALRTLEMMERQVSDYNINLPVLNATIKDVKLRIRYTPHNLTPNIEEAMKFDKAQMLKWWNEGYEYAEREDTSVKVRINKFDQGLKNFKYL